MPYKVDLSDEAKQDCKDWQAQNPATAERIQTLLKAIEDNPFKGIGKPEPLEHGLTGFWSRRINQEHRILYSIKDNSVWVHRCRGHYKLKRSQH